MRYLFLLFWVSTVSASSTIEFHVQEGTEGIRHISEDEEKLAQSFLNLVKIFCKEEERKDVKIYGRNITDKAIELNILMPPNCERDFVGVAERNLSAVREIANHLSIVGAKRRDPKGRLITENWKRILINVNPPNFKE